MANWYYMQDGVRVGPVTGNDLKRIAAVGTLRPADLVWREGMAEWVAAAKVNGLFATAQSPVPQPQQPLPPVPSLPPIPLQAPPVSGVMPESHPAGPPERLERPIVIAVLGWLVPVTIIAAKAVGSGTDPLNPYLLVFAGFALVMSSTYAYLGWKYSKAVANRVLQIGGSIVAVIGLLILFSALGRGF